MLSPPNFPCPWASEWGEDDYGLWQTLVFSGVRQVFRWIEPGSFMMGSLKTEEEREWLKELKGFETQHLVRLTKGFWLADSAVTQAYWLAVMGGDNRSSFQDDLQNPVEQVSWDDTQLFIAKLNELLPGLHVRLPSEAQWEYACRAGTSTPFSFGNSITPNQVNYNGEYPYTGGQKGLNRRKTVPVKSLPANTWGLYEMHGNVWEWCADAWQQDLGGKTAVDPVTTSDQGPRYMLRGGSWNDIGLDVRSAVRDHGAPDDRGFNLGFRLSLGHTELKPAGGGAGQD